VYVLGGLFEFESSSRALLRLVAEAYAGLPRHRLTRSTPRFRIRLHVTPGDAEAGSAAAPPAHLHGGAGLLSVVMDAANFAVICPAERSGLVAISRTSLLRYPRLVRYELLEFAVFALAHRGLGLVSLHAGCVGWQRRGLLLIGESGAGKSTLALHGAHRGLDFLTEDATFVDTSTMLATGVSNFLHLNADALRYLDDDVLTRRIGKSPTIRRRSGVEKLEIDMRRLGTPLAAKPVTVAGIAFLSMTPVGKGPLLRNVKRRELLARLESSQAYAANQGNWKTFVQRALSLPALELRRARHPADGVDALRACLIEG
jgi:hypothetical protein